jgi:hypothetical protein
MDDLDRFKLRRFIAAYKLGLANEAEALGSPPESWGRGQVISKTEEEQHLTAEDKFRIPPCPYPGLRSFRPDEGELFFGRERNIEVLRNILAQRRVVVVLGGSGSGKSSLVRAGLLQFLNTRRRIEGRPGNWYAVEFRPRTDPVGELSAALVKQLFRPLLKLGGARVVQALGVKDAGPDSEAAATMLEHLTRQRFTAAKSAGRDRVLDALLEIVDRELERSDEIVTRGNRIGEPNLLLLVDQLEEVFRPEIDESARKMLLDLVVDIHAHMQTASRRGGLFLVATMRSEEVNRCAEHRGLSEVVIGSGYQIEVPDLNDREDWSNLRAAIVQPGHNVFEDWGLSSHLTHEDAPFEAGLPKLLLDGAACLAVELDHRPDQLPLLQHAVQSMWHSAMRRWSEPGFGGVLEIARQDLPGQAEQWDAPDLSACLKARADKAADRAAERFATHTATNQAAGTDALQAAFRALARRDDNGNWARRFAGRDEITAFLAADPNLQVVAIPEDSRWAAVAQALNVFLLRGYLNRGGDGKYDISHEALIRNWPLFRNWLRGPNEVAYMLGRILMEIDPRRFEKASADEQMQWMPEELATRALAVSEDGALPVQWGEDQIAPYLLRPLLRRRWGDDKRQVLHRLTGLALRAQRAREAADEQAREAAREQARRAAREQARKRYKSRLVVAIAIMAAIGGFLAQFATFKRDIEQRVNRLTTLAEADSSTDFRLRLILLAAALRDSNTWFGRISVSADRPISAVRDTVVRSPVYGGRFASGAWDSSGRYVARFDQNTLTIHDLKPGRDVESRDLSASEFSLPEGPVPPSVGFIATNDTIPAVVAFQSTDGTLLTLQGTEIKKISVLTTIAPGTFIPRALVQNNELRIIILHYFNNAITQMGIVRGSDILRTQSQPSFKEEILDWQPLAQRALRQPILADDCDTYAYLGDSVPNQEQTKQDFTLFVGQFGRERNSSKKLPGLVGPGGGALAIGRQCGFVAARDDNRTLHIVRLAKGELAPAENPVDVPMTRYSDIVSPRIPQAQTMFAAAPLATGWRVGWPTFNGLAFMDIGSDLRTTIRGPMLTGMDPGYVSGSLALSPDGSFALLIQQKDFAAPIELGVFNLDEDSRRRDLQQRMATIRDWIQEACRTANLHPATNKLTPAELLAWFGQTDAPQPCAEGGR